jgi:pectate lyase
MRYKSLPLSARHPRPPREPQNGPMNSRPRPGWLEWLLTVPIILLIPALVVPILSTGQRVPTLAVGGVPVPGSSVMATGAGFPSASVVTLTWDGSSRTWLPAPTTTKSGKFSVRIALPTAVALGKHTLLARAEVSHGKSAKKTVAAASVSVTVVSAAATPSPTPASLATPVPPAATPTPTPTPTPTASASTPPPTAGSYIGYGSAAVGGRGGTEKVVSNLNDSGPGSLRAALESSGARIVVFDVAGTITLTGDLRISDPYVTVAGETAPPAGIVLRNGALKVTTHDVILRQIRLRPGDLVDTPADVDALTLNGMNDPVFNVVVDHVSMVWGPDIGGLAVLGNVHDVTISSSIMGEGLYLSRHPEATVAGGGHSMAANLSQLDSTSPWPTRITFWHDLFTTSDNRMPRLQGAACVDLVNNVIYNWGQRAAHGNPRSVNVVANWYRSGPESIGDEFWTPQTSVVAPSLFAGAVYLAGNTADGSAMSRGGSTSVYADSLRCGGLSVDPGTPAVAYQAVIAGAGATLPVRDTVDKRIIANVINRTGAFFNGAGYGPPNPYYP